MHRAEIRSDNANSVNGFSGRAMQDTIVDLEDHSTVNAVKVVKVRNTGTKTKVLAIASRGGHWIQLLRLRAAFVGFNVTFVTTDPAYNTMLNGEKFIIVSDANRNQKLRMCLLAAQIIWILVRERPTVIVTTGAAPGYLAVRIGKWLGIRTLWIDSIANAEELSLSGKLAKRYATVALTQWSHLATEGLKYVGAVI